MENLNNNSIIDRIYNIYNNIDFKNIKLPKALKLEFSAICNHKCNFCIVPKIQQNYIENNTAFMKENVFITALNEAKRLKIKEIGLFHLGESTLHPKFKEYVNIIKQIYPKCKIFITTNGTNLDAMKECIQLNINSLKFSLNGYNRKKHYEYTKVDNFNLIINNLKQCIEFRNKINSITQISASSIFFNSKKQEKFVNNIKKYVDCHFYTPMYIHPGNNNTKINYTNNNILNTQIQHPCLGLYTLCHIKTNGDVNLCRFGSNSNFTVGNILTSKLDNIWFSEKANKLRNDNFTLLNEQCKKCIESL